MSQAIGLLRRGLHEVPHLVLGSVAFIGSGIGLYFVSKHHIKHDKRRRAWKRRYVVVREEDFDPKKQVHKVDQKYPFF
ncbi:uncharacterized protein TNIN_458481 [Trichonephila inaurata madagascariensis]|uniref:Uncharacterized protein n=1 Tax=Trichonephila inaurata madagascariensis TaxID=2747483 RepID=A0A8X6IJT5_9ARAC|nr:uncharacterized protein TNIN_458481 [Trichonephila inaurata madagascariensis]